MISLLVPLLLQAGQKPPAPRRNVPDPGVIATTPQVTAAGVQSGFNGRVTGVRFGTQPGELWGAVPGSAYRRAWADNRVLARGSFEGRAGVQAVAIDPVKRRALVSTIGRVPVAATEGQMPGTLPRLASRPAAQLTFFDDGARGDAVAPAFTSGGLGEYAVGAPAVGPKPNDSGPPVPVVPLTVEDRLAVLDPDNRQPLSSGAPRVAPN